MKARIVVWRGPCSEYRDDAGFKTLNEYKYGPIKSIEEKNSVIAEEMEKEISMLYPDFQYNHAQLITEEDMI